MGGWLGGEAEVSRVEFEDGPNPYWVPELPDPRGVIFHSSLKRRRSPSGIRHAHSLESPFTVMFGFDSCHETITINNRNV